MPGFSQMRALASRAVISGQKSLNVSAHDEGPLVLQEQRGQGGQVRRSRIAHGISVSHVSREFDIRIRQYRRVLRMSNYTEACRVGEIAFTMVGDPDRPGELHRRVNVWQEPGRGEAAE